MPTGSPATFLGLLNLGEDGGLMEKRDFSPLQDSVTQALTLSTHNEVRKQSKCQRMSN